MNYYQQGDVLLKRVSELPAKLTPLKTKILQSGETTGHKHQFQPRDKVKLFAEPDTVMPGMRIHTHDGVTYIEVETESLLTHEEHKPISIAPGIYQIDLVREFNYDEIEIQPFIN